MQIEGKKIVDIGELVDVFRAQEGTIESLSGGIGQGKTYEATRMALQYLDEGKVVYTNWHLILDEEVFDQRRSLRYAFWNMLFFRKRFFVINKKENWHYVDMSRPDLVDFVASLTDCVVLLDEGQDIFDSYEGTKMSKKKRMSLTRTRHLNKTLVIISQRPQAIAVTARANVNTFYRCVKTISWPVVHFKILATEEIDAQNMPLWEDAKVVRSHFAKGRVFRAYNSWYLRAGIPKSQDVHFEAYDFGFLQRVGLFGVLLIRSLGLKAKRTASMGLNRSNEVKELAGVPTTAGRTAELPF